jgi:hypothetical protein
MTVVQDGPCDAAIVEGIEDIGKCHCVVPGGVVFIRGLPDEPLLSRISHERRFTTGP